ncbi:hypothetical protein [Roseibium sp.]|uniref:alpha/beta hydrolase n=1 Tax=Roseibium sp. TaxID=1936156 RepID=UPI00326713F0
MSFVPSVPLCFDGLAAVLTRPAPEVPCRGAVLLCRPWGFDELCSRKFYRVLAETLAERGLASLRFDYPDTVDSLDTPEGSGLDDWTAAANRAGDALKRSTGVDRIALFGLGVGAVVARNAARTRKDISAIVLAAPVTSGRRYLRETDLRAKVLYERLNIQPEGLPRTKYSIAGIALPDPLATDLALVKPAGPGLPGDVPALLCLRPDLDSDTAFAEHLRSDTPDLDVIGFSGYEDLMIDPLRSKVPQETVSRIADWLASTLTAPGAITGAVTGASENPADMTALAGNGFTETAAFFGQDSKQLFAVSSSPEEARAGRPVFLFGNTGGYDHHGGWARSWVKICRSLARGGAETVRFDMANVGDSPPKDGIASEILYSDGPVADFGDAVDWLDAHHDGPLTLVGRCSSSHAALHAARSGRTISRVVLCNPLVYIWDPDEVVDVNRLGFRTAEAYRKKMTDPRTLKRLVTGDINIRSVLRGMTKLGGMKLASVLSKVLPRLTKHGRFKLQALEIFAELRDRGIPVHFFCSAGDGSLELLEFHFGQDLSGLKAYPNMSVFTVENADHNLTPEPAQKVLEAFLGDLVGQDLAKAK